MGGQETEIYRPLFSRGQLHLCDSHSSDSELTLTFQAYDTGLIFHGFVRVRAISVIELITDSYM